MVLNIIFTTIIIGFAILFPNMFGATILIVFSIYSVNCMLSPFGEFKWIDKTEEDKKDHIGKDIGGWFEVLFWILITLFIVGITARHIACSWILQCNDYDDYGNCTSYSDP